MDQGHVWSVGRLYRTTSRVLQRHHPDTAPVVRSNRLHLRPALRQQPIRYGRSVYLFLRWVTASDTKPGQLTPEARRGLRIFTQRVIEHLEVRRANVLLRKQLLHFTQQLTEIREQNPENYRQAHVTNTSAPRADHLFPLSYDGRSLPGRTSAFTEHEELTPENIKAYTERMKEVIKELNVYTSHLTKLFLDKRGTA